MNVLLIYPGMSEGFGSAARSGAWLNHGVGIISALLKRDGHAVRYLDLRMLPDWDEAKRQIAAAPFDIALISVCTVDFGAARTLAQIIKAGNPSVKVLVGGAHPTLVTDATAAVPEFDFIFTNEAEVTLPKVLHDLGKAPRVIKGEMPSDLDAVPFVDRTLIPGGETAAWSGLPEPFFTITASRGCAFHCTFCQPAERILFGDKVRKRSVGNLLQELEGLKRDRGMRSFMVYDDCFTQFPAWVDEFCARKKERGIDAQFICQSRADIICNRREMIARLAGAGLKWVLIGFESGSDRVLQYVKKGTTVEQNIRAADICRELGVKIVADYMFGLPTETREEMKATVRMMRRIRPDRHSPAVFTPTPGSFLHEHCVRDDLMLIKDWSDYRREGLLGGAKIKGVDYNFVTRMVLESMHGPLKGRFLHLAYRSGKFVVQNLWRGKTGPKSRRLRALWAAK